MVQKAKILINSVVAGDIDNYTRACHMMDIFQVSIKRINDSVEGIGNSSEPVKFDKIDEPDSVADASSASAGFPYAHVSLCMASSFH